MIYFIQAIEGGPIKIGYSKNIEKRLQTIQSNSPLKLQILASFEGSIDTEKTIHYNFSKHRSHGEWFYPHDEVLEVIDKGLDDLEDYRKKTILILREKGYTLNYIGVRLGLSRQRIHQILKEKT